jgi:hypothetical protein
MDGKVLSAGVVHNGIVLDSIDDLLDVYFSDGTPQTTWHLGLISNVDWDEEVGVANDDTMALHPGWVEAENYEGDVRPAWDPEVASDGLKRNTEPAEFVIDVVEELKGMFVTSDSDAGGIVGNLWATGVFTTTNTPPIGATFKLTYELEAREG